MNKDPRPGEVFFLTISVQGRERHGSGLPQGVESDSGAPGFCPTYFILFHEEELF